MDPARRSKSSGSPKHRARSRGRRSEVEDHRSRSHQGRHSPEPTRHRGRRSRRSHSRRRGSRRERHSRQRGVSQSLSQLSDVIKGMDSFVKNIGATTKNNLTNVTPFSNAIIQEFNPMLQGINEWLAAVDEFAYIYGWNDATTCHLALTKLKGPAEVWYRGLPTRIFSWPEWKALLIKSFPSKRNLHKILEQLMSCTSRNYPTFYQYTYEKLALINKLDLAISGEDSVNLILGRISNEQIKFTIETAAIKDISTLTVHLKTLDDQGCKQVLAATNVPGTPVKGTGNRSQPGVYKTNEEGRCFKCKSPGYFCCKPLFLRLWQALSTYA